VERCVRLSGENVLPWRRGFQPSPLPRLDTSRGLAVVGRALPAARGDILAEIALEVENALSNFYEFWSTPLDAKALKRPRRHTETIGRFVLGSEQFLFGNVGFH
jgi:hypothetical protein